MIPGKKNIMRKGNFLISIVLPVLFTSCAVSKNYNPNKKIPKQELQEDYSLLRNILEKKHPALYWYTPKDSMNYYFDSLYNNITDSMTELQFGWKVLAPLTQKIHCGHTSFGMSSQWNKFIRNRRIPSFPLYLKVWNDTMVVTDNINRKDSIIKKGTLITSVNGIRNRELIKQLFNYLPLDGYADNVNYIRLSNNFPYYHRNVFGIYKNYRVGYIDRYGTERTTIVSLFNPPLDTSKKKKIVPLVKIPRAFFRKERIENSRSLAIDSSSLTATFSLNTFSNGEGRHLRTFIKRSFRQIRRQQIKNCIIDLRSNGGGDISMYVLLTKFLHNKRFKVADTSYAVSKTLRLYTRYFRQGFFYNAGLYFFTRKQRDGKYHFGYWERHTYKPKKRNHFNGKLYVLTNGSTFSASTLFCNAVKGQSNVKIVGEETGGGWHGNSGIMIPDITLPSSKLRVRLPLFKLVQYNHVPKNGRGVIPDTYIPPTVDGVRRGIDRKMEIVKAMIDNESTSTLPKKIKR